jgi:hypothetical protein
MMENCSGFKIIATYGVDGVLLSLQEPFEWGYGRTLEKAGSHSQAFLDLWWEMGLRLDFGMIYDVGIQFSSMLFLLFMVLYLCFPISSILCIFGLRPLYSI